MDRLDAALPIEVSGDLSVHRLVRARAELTPRDVFIAAPGRANLTYDLLLAHIDEVARSLNGMGFGRGDRVALVSPTGPETVVALLAIAIGATVAPLNPALTEAELGFAFRDLRVRALIVHVELDSSIREVAARCGIPTVDLVPDREAEAGIFRLTGISDSRPIRAMHATADDVALALHTSGTSARPKIVPLTHANICASARYAAAAPRLLPSDRAYLFGPMFTIAGFIAPLASVAAGASLACPPGFGFFEWLEELRPTWYTAVPTVHRAILDQANSHRELIARCPLRFIYSGSAPLPPLMLDEMESVFGAPVVEGYGLTEAAPLTSNPLPGRRKIGTVGLPIGDLDLAIMGESGEFLPKGEAGEVIVRGPNVFSGYEANPEVNLDAFVDGWFRTGDQGFLDEDGYLFLTGRLKELINRGGEKIAPRQVEEVLLAHPAVAQAVTFAVPDARLGEDVAAAVVLREHMSASEAEIRSFAATRLANSKVPRRVAFVAELPKGPTGKLQRVGLAERLSLTATSQTQRVEAYVAPRTPVEEALAGIWAEVLELERVGVHDDFLELGGHSLLAFQLLSRVGDTFGMEVPLRTIIDSPTVAEMAKAVEEELTKATKLQPETDTSRPRSTTRSSGFGRLGDHGK